MAGPRMDNRSLGRATLARQQLLDRVELPVHTLLRRVGGLQAQEPRPPFLGLWNRLQGFQPDHLRRAVEERQVVRVSLQRGTLHLVNAADFRTWRAALAAELAALPNGLGGRTAGIEPDATRQAGRELLRGQPMRFNDLRPLLARRFPGTDDRVLGVVVRLGLPLVMVPDGSRWCWPADARFALAEEWLPDWAESPDPSPEEAREQLVIAHLAAFGPARAADVAAWSGLRGVQAVLDRLAPRLDLLADEQGRQLYDLPGAPRPSADVPAPPRLLGEWDTVLLGLADHSRVVDPDVRARLMTSNGRLRNALLIGGRVVGGWHLALARGRALVTLEPFVPVPKRAASQAADEAVRLARWLHPDADVDVELAQRS